MLTVSLPPHFFEERRYAVMILLEWILGFEVQYKTYNQPHYSLEWDTGKVMIRDDFFNRFNEEEGYCKVSALPKPPEYVEDCGVRFPVMFGQPQVEGDNCEADIIASAFFMLTRWEEHVLPHRDKHDRFIGKQSYAFKNGFLDRAIVHDYADFLALFLEKNGYAAPRKQRNFTWVLSHDLDIPYKWTSLKRLFTSLGGDILKRKSLSECINTGKSFFNTRFKQHPDPFDAYDALMDWSESLQTTSIFNIMAAFPSQMDEGYDVFSPPIQALFAHIRQRGHRFGFHPGYYTYHDKETFKNEHDRLEKALGESITTGRQHFLRASFPETWQVWEDMGMSVDSSGGYADVEGFRFGMCIAFPVFNILTHKCLRLLEQPLIAMEVTLAEYQGYSPQQTADKLKSLAEVVKHHHGDMTLLWHNHCAGTAFWKPYEYIRRTICHT
jgi:hypothetical protein